MAPRKRANANKEQQKKTAVLLADFDKKMNTRLQDFERQTKNLMKQLTNYYVQEVCKLSKNNREMKMDDFLAGKGQSVTASLGKIEEEINQAVQLPTAGKKLRSATKPLPSSALRAVTRDTPLVVSSGLPPAPPSRSTVRKKRTDTELVDMDSVEEAVAVKTKQLDGTKTYLPTPVPETGPSIKVNDNTFNYDEVHLEIGEGGGDSVMPGAINDKTFNFDEVSPDQGADFCGGGDSARPIGVFHTPKIDFDLARTAKKEDINENIPITLKKTFAATTVCRKPVPNELLWSERGSPVVVDPRTALTKTKVQAAISIKQGAIALTGSPIGEDSSKCPQLDATDIELFKKLNAKMLRMIEINETRAKETNQPGTSSQ